MGVVEIRKRPVQTEVVNIRWRALEARGAQASAGGCAGRVHRHVVNGLAEGVGEAEIQSMFVAVTRSDEQGVVVGVAARILEKDLPELRIRTDVVQRERPALRAGQRQAVHACGEIADVAALQVSLRRAAVNERRGYQLQEQRWRLA